MSLDGQSPNAKRPDAPADIGALKVLASRVAQAARESALPHETRLSAFCAAAVREGQSAGLTLQQVIERFVAVAQGVQALASTKTFRGEELERFVKGHVYRPGDGVSLRDIKRAYLNPKGEP